MTTRIQWTDETWNPVTGCSKVSAGCKNCYAERLVPRVFAGQETKIPTTMNGQPGFGLRPRRFTDVRCHPERLDAPLRWRKPRRVFVNSMSDLFHEDASDEFIAEVFGVAAVSAGAFFGAPPRSARAKPANGPHTFQVLTKRPDRMQSLLASTGFREAVSCAAHRRAHNRTDAGYLSDCISRDDNPSAPGRSGRLWPLPNVWLGVSVENQETADERIPILLDTPAAVRFVSYEPAIGPLQLFDRGCPHPIQTPRRVVMPAGSTLDWIIVGGESGPNARPCDVAWIRSIVEQCKAAGVPCFVKQLGANPTGADGMFDRGALSAMRDRKGGDPSEWSEDLRVREYPAVEVIA